MSYNTSLRSSGRGVRAWKYSIHKALSLSFDFDYLCFELFWKKTLNITQLTNYPPAWTTRRTTRQRIFFFGEYYAKSFSREYLATSANVWFGVLQRIKFVFYASVLVRLRGRERDDRRLYSSELRSTKGLARIIANLSLA